MKKKTKRRKNEVIVKKNPPGRPRKYNDPEYFDDIIQSYFDWCDSKRMKYTFSGLALALGLDVKTVRNYKKDERFYPSIARARLLIMQQYEQELFREQGSTAGVQFALKNNFAEYKDEQEVKSVQMSYEDYLKSQGIDI